MRRTQPSSDSRTAATGATIIPFRRRGKAEREAATARASRPAEPSSPEETGPVLSEFYVHAVLQAARARHLGLDPGSAKSWGLNRAIFHEAAKKGYFRRRGGRTSAGGATGKSVGRHSPGGQRKPLGVLFKVGGERAYSIHAEDRSGEIWFAIGGRAQRPRDFDRRIARRFPNWELVWKDAMTLMDDARPWILNSASRFHREIYRRWRTELARNWARGESAIPVIERKEKAAKSA